MTDAQDDRAAGEQHDDQGTASLVETRLALLAAAYPALVTDESRELIRSEIGHAIARDVRLRRYRVGNGDVPMALFRPYRMADPEGDE